MPHATTAADREHRHHEREEVDQEEAHEEGRDREPDDDEADGAAVAPGRARIAGHTDCCVAKLKPRSPWARWLQKRPYCVQTGWSKPYWRCTAFRTVPDALPPI